MADQQLQCNQCDYKSMWKTSIRRHKRSEHEGITYTCNRCHQKIKWSKNSLKEHIDRKHKTATEKCDQCEYVAGNQQILSRHIAKVHEEKYKRKWNCSFCDKTTTSKYGLRMHVRYVHEGVKREPGEVINLWRCGQCEKYFNRKYNRDQHERNYHHNLPRTRYPRN